MGIKADAEIRGEYSIYKYKDLNQYINNVGKKLLKYVQIKKFRYKFTILDTPVVNAFSIPGGFVYITRGILAYINNEAQLAAVLGHELGHINARHAANMISKKILFNFGLRIVYTISPEFRRFSGLVSQGVGLLFLKFSRNDEYQADALGVQYATEAGYNTYEMAKFFETLNKLEKQQKYSLPEFLSTHPNPPHRIQKVLALTKIWQERVKYKKFKIGKLEYLKHIDGILFGKNKRNGYVEGNTYYHPNMRFTFNFPKGWKLTDTKKYILITYKRIRDIQVLITLSSKSFQETIDNFLRKSKGLIISYNKLKINGFDAVKIVEYVKLENRSVIKTYFINYNGKIFVFYCVSPVIYYKVFSKDLDIVPLSFKELKDKSKINVKNKYVKVVEVNRSTTLKRLLLKYKVKKKDFNTVAIMNNLSLTSHLKKGDYIKILIER